MTNIFGEKLKKLRESKGLSQEELGGLIGTSKQVISRYENSHRSPKISTVALLAKALGVELNYFSETADENSVPYIPSIINPEDILEIKRHKIPFIGDIACGEPIVAVQEYESYVEAGAEIHADFALRAKGDSMIGVRIYDGDIVFIRRQSTVDNGEIAAVIIDDEATLKRVYKLRDGTVELRAENPRYDPIHLGGEDDVRNVHILGKAIAFQSDVK